MKIFGIKWRSLIFRISHNLLFLGSLKTVWMLYLFSILSIGPLFLLYMEEWKRFFCPSHLVIVVCWGSLPYWCLLIILFISFLSCSFFCKAYFRWLSSICKYSLSEMVKALCTSELIADFFVLGDVTQHVSIYPYVLLF